MFKLMSANDAGLPEPHDIPDLAKMQRQSIQCTMDWSQLEVSLADLINAALNINLNDTYIGYSIFNAPTSIEARFALVDACVSTVVAENNKLKELGKYWPSINKKLNSLRKNRNILAHGTISVFRKPNSKKLYVRFYNPVKDLRKALSGILPGLSTNDLDNYLFNIHLVTVLIEAVDEVITSYHTDKRKSLKKKYLRLEDCLQKFGDHE